MRHVNNRLGATLLYGFFSAYMGLAAPALAQPPSLRFTTQEFAPFNYEADGKVVGPATEIVAATFARAGIACSFVQLPWARAQAEVQDGRANGMFLIGWFKERAAWLHFSPPLIKSEYGFFVHASDRREYRDLADAQDWTVATYGPSNLSVALEGLRARMIARQLRPITIDMRPGDEDGFRKLALARVNAVFSSRDIGFAVVTRLGLRADIRYAGKTSELNYYVGFSKQHNDQAILARFDAAVTALAASGKIREILEPHDMQPADPRLDVARTGKD